MESSGIASVLSDTAQLVPIETRESLPPSGHGTSVDMWLRLTSFLQIIIDVETNETLERIL